MSENIEKFLILEKKAWRWIVSKKKKTWRWISNLFLFFYIYRFPFIFCRTRKKKFMRYVLSQLFLSTFYYSQHSLKPGCLLIYIYTLDWTNMTTNLINYALLKRIWLIKLNAWVKIIKKKLYHIKSRSYILVSHISSKKVNFHNLFSFFLNVTKYLTAYIIYPVYAWYLKGIEIQFRWWVIHLKVKACADEGTIAGEPFIFPSVNWHTLLVLYKKRHNCLH